MQTPQFTRTDDLFLMPGGFWFGAAPARITTILGSCIALTLWHPQKQVGGMCHYLLPDSRLPLVPDKTGRTAGEAVALFLQAIQAQGTHPQDYQVKLFGGASMFGETAGFVDHTRIGIQNILAARSLLSRHGFSLLREDVGGHRSRKIILDLSDGDVWMR